MVLKWLVGVALSRLCIYFTLWAALHTFVCLCFCVFVFLCICICVYLYLCEFDTPWSSSGWMVLLYPASVSTSHFGPRSILDDLPAVYERHRQMTTSKRWYEKKEWQHTLKPDKVISYEWMMLAWRLLESLGRSTVAPGLPSFFERKRRRWIEETMKSATSMDFSLIPL